MTDPRLTGTLSSTLNIDDFMSPDPFGSPPLSGRDGYGVVWGTWLLTADDGTWEGDFTGSSTSAESAWAARSGVEAVVETGWLKGSGAYEGLSASVQVVVADTYGSADGVVSAMIFPGNPPPDR